MKEMQDHLIFAFVHVIDDIYLFATRDRSITYSEQVFMCMLKGFGSSLTVFMVEYTHSVCKKNLSTPKLV